MGDIEQVRASIEMTRYELSTYSFDAAAARDMKADADALERVLAVAEAAVAVKNATATTNALTSIVDTEAWEDAMQAEMDAHTVFHHAVAALHVVDGGAQG